MYTRRTCAGIDGSGAGPFPRPLARFVKRSARAVMALTSHDADDCATQMGRLQRGRAKRGLTGLVALMSVAAVAAFFGISRCSPATPPVSEEQARVEANEIVKHLARFDGYPFDARYSKGARDQAVRLAELTKDAYDYFAVVLPGARPQVVVTFLRPADW